MAFDVAFQARVYQERCNPNIPATLMTTTGRRRYEAGRFLAPGAYISLAASLALFGYGTIHSGIFAQPALSLGGMARLAAVCGVYWVLVLCAIRWTGR